MSKNKYEIGMIVKHDTAPDWGLGEIVTVNGTMITISFEHAGQKELDSAIAPLTKEADVNYFANPEKIYSLNELWRKRLPPSSSGVYGWYFYEPPPYVQTNGCTPVKTGRWPFRTKWWLLYIGQADNLKDRIMKYHIGGGHYAQGTMSSLRLSLGCLLSDRFGLKLYYPPESFGKKGEKLNKWLEECARIAWIETPYLNAVESRAIEKYTLPLNYKHSRHPIAKPLSELRTEFKNIARSQKPKKKHFRRAYKQFVKECNK